MKETLNRILSNFRLFIEIITALLILAGTISVTYIAVKGSALITAFRNMTEPKDKDMILSSEPEEDDSLIEGFPQQQKLYCNTDELVLHQIW